MNKSESIKNLAVALRKAQSEFEAVKFDSVNPFYSSKYASLGAVIQATKKVLADNGLVVSQPATTNEFGVGITTILMHDSGEFIKDTVTIPFPEPTYIDGKGKTKQNNFAQEAGKNIKYLRRYALSSILNIYADEDNDGNAPKQSAPQKKNSAGVALKDAENEKGQDGKRYGDCDDEVLKGKLMGITTWINNHQSDTSPTMDKYLWKLEAIKMIQESRK